MMNWQPAGLFEGGELKLPNGCIDADGKWLNTVELQEISGVEEEALSNKSYTREGTALLKVLTGCVTRIGHHTDKASVARYVKKLTMGDGLFLLVRLRQLSLEENIVNYKDPCPKCHAEHLRKIDLSAQQVAYRPEDEPLTEGFEVKLGKRADAATARFRVLTVDDNPKLIAFKRENPDALESFRLWLSLTDYSGGKLENWTYVQRWKLLARTMLRDAIEREEYGMDVFVDNECPACHHTWRMTLPVNDPAFFLRLETL